MTYWKSIFDGFVTKQKASLCISITVIVFSLIFLLDILAPKETGQLETIASNMTPSALLSLTISAISLLIQRNLILRHKEIPPPLSDKNTWIALGLAGSLMIVGLFELQSTSISFNLTWENLLHDDSSYLFSSNKAPQAPTAFTSIFAIVTGLGFFTLTLAPSWPWVWQFFPCIGIIFATLITGAYSFDLDLRDIDQNFPQIAITTCIGYLLIFIGMLFLRADVGLFKPFNEDNPGADILRKRGPIMFVFFAVLTKSLHIGAAANLYSTQFALLTFVTLSTTAFFFVFYALAMELNSAHAKLQKSELFSKSILDISPSMITIFRTDNNRYIFASSRISEILGYSVEEITNQEDILEKLVHPEDRQSIIAQRLTMRQLGDNDTYTYQFRWQHKNGSWRTLRTTTTPYRRNNKGHITHLLSSTTDISDLEQLRKSLEASNQELLAERQKLLSSNRDLEFFASVAAHDLKSPLQSVLGWVDTLRETIIQPRPKIVDDAISFIEKSIDRSIKLINDLLNISRLNCEPVFRVRCNISQIVSYVISSLEQDLSKVQPKIFIGNLPDAPGIQVQYENVFSNLIRNAINYRCPDRPLEIEINGHDGDHHCEFYVKDNGLGIPPEHHESIFDLFKRVHADDDHPGNGMGLAYCRKVIDLLGGKIWVESTVNQGSMFRFTVPKA
jgi:PAS domain S-box-containing protein